MEVYSLHESAKESLNENTEIEMLQEDYNKLNDLLQKCAEDNHEKKKKLLKWKRKIRNYRMKM